MQRALRTGLRYHDFEVRAVGTGEDAVREAAAWRPDVILLDLGLPGMDGFATLRALRPTTRAGVIVVSVMPGEKDKVRALDAGADDYVVKPFGTDELVARIRAVLRRQADVSAGEPVIRTGDLEIDLARRSVTVGGRVVKLTRRSTSCCATSRFMPASPSHTPRGCARCGASMPSVTNTTPATSSPRFARSLATIPPILGTSSTSRGLGTGLPLLMPSVEQISRDQSDEDDSWRPANSGSEGVDRRRV